MRNAMIRKRHLLLLLFLSSFFLSCEDKMDEHYEKPAWLKGTAWEVLSSDEYGSKYSMFLEAAELSGFRPVLDGKSIATVMAPDNDAFADYLEKKSYVSVKDIPTDDLKKLIGFHLIYYSYNKSDLENFRPENNSMGEDEEELGMLQPGMYYKFRTHSTSPVTTEVDQINKKTVTVYHLERFLPIFSHYIFKSKGIDAKKNYEYFYPNSTWTGDDGFNVSNASVTNYQIIANNGYVYTINKVLEPLETIYDVMKKKTEYSDFLDFYNTYSTYEYDQDLSNDYSNAVGVDSLFLHKHQNYGLANIALEWPVSNYRLFPELASISYSVFAPSNNAFDDFHKKYWLSNGYPTLANVDPLPVKLLIDQCVYGGSIVFPDEVKTLKNNYGTSYSFDPYTVKDKSICVNGSFYGLDKLELPAMFQSVIGPAFLNAKYVDFLYTLNQANMLQIYSSDVTKYTFLLTDNENFEISDMKLIPNGVEYMLGEPGDDDDYKAVSTSTLQRILNVHTVAGELDLKNQARGVFTTQHSGTYWLVRNGKIATNDDFNSILGLTPNEATLSSIFVDVEEVKNDGADWNNGKVYAYAANDAGVFGYTTGKTMKNLLTSAGEKKYPYFVFAQLMRAAGMFQLMEDGKTYSWWTELSGRIVAFIPSNDVLAKALQEGKISGIEGSVDADGVLNATVTDAVALRTYLTNYIFNSTSTPQVSGCPYIGSDTWLTGAYQAINGVTVNYNDNGASLSVQWKGGAVRNVVPDYECFPFAFSDGAFHIIDGVFN